MSSSNIFRLFLGLLTTCLILQAAFAENATATEMQTLAKNDFEKMFVEVIGADSLLADAELRISNVTAQPESMAVPIGEVKYQVINQPRTDRLGRKTMTLALLINGNEQGRVRIQGNVGRISEVLYTSRALRRDTILGPDDIRIVRRDITMLGPDIVSDPGSAIGMRLNTSLTAGAILYSSLLTPPPLVGRGDLVTIRIRTANLLVTVPGEVRNTGAAGDLVRVKNLMSRKELFARVIDPGTVEVPYK